MLALYKVRLMFEWGGGRISCGNNAALERFDVGSRCTVYAGKTASRAWGGFRGGL